MLPTGPDMIAVTPSTAPNWSVNWAGGQPRKNFATGLEKTVRWYLDNAAWVADVQSGEGTNSGLRKLRCSRLMGSRLTNDE